MGRGGVRIKVGSGLDRSALLSSDGGRLGGGVGCDTRGETASWSVKELHEVRALWGRFGFGETRLERGGSSKVSLPREDEEV